jgi:hypothetical protein
MEMWFLGLEATKIKELKINANKIERNNKYAKKI